MDRFQLLAILFATLAISVGAIILTIILAAQELAPACYALFGGGPVGGSEAANCPGYQTFRDLNSNYGDKLQIGLGILPFVAGGLLGAALVGREVEQRTAMFNWSVSTSRTRWLAERTLALALALVIILSVAAIAGTLLAQAGNPAFAPDATFRGYGARGQLVVVRGLAAFAIGVLIGAWLGRVLPALIVTAALCFGLFLVLPVAVTAGVRVDPVSFDDPRAGGQASVLVGSGWRLADGSIIDDETARAGTPYPNDAAATAQWLENTYDGVALTISGERYPEIEWRETVMLLVLATLSLTGATLITRRRRPY